MEEIEASKKTEAEAEVQKLKERLANLENELDCVKSKYALEKQVLQHVLAVNDALEHKLDQLLNE